MRMTRRVLTMAGALAAGACVFAATVMVRAQAPAPPRTLQDGVYAAAQAGRGQALYERRCAGCHGPALGGGTAPALTGEAFARTWRLEPLSALFIKVRHTMPPNADPKLTDDEAAAVVAFLLARNGFPPGSELAAADAAADTTVWPAPASGPGPRSYPPTGNLAQLMRSVFFPNSNLIFTVQTRDPAEPVPPPSPAAGGAGFSVFEWGQGIYTGWPVIENAAAAIADASPLMLLEGLKCENGRMAPVTDADWIRFTDEMIAVAKRTYRLAQTRDQEAVSFATGDLSDACANCHRAYRDVGRGRGADPFAPGANAGRCTPR